LLDLSGKVAIVTGASRGIGRAVAVRLASRGAQVVAVARGNNAAGTVAEIQAAGGKAVAVSADVTDRSSIDAVIVQAVDQFGHIDILVNNAGITRDQLLMRMKTEDWDQVIATNLTAAFGCAQAVIKPMIKQRSGRIINISSVIGLMGNAGQANYAASKAGLIGLTKSLARELASRGITVNAIAPGYISTDMTNALSEEIQKSIQDKIPLKRVGTPDEIAAAVAFLASSEAAYITGQTLCVDGGIVM
jgi:3-oxoacyl-[acyl-carrier protein] reductase